MRTTYQLAASVRMLVHLPAVQLKAYPALQLAAPHTPFTHCAPDPFNQLVEHFLPEDPQLLIYKSRDKVSLPYLILHLERFQIPQAKAHIRAVVGTAEESEQRTEQALLMRLVFEEGGRVGRGGKRAGG